MCDNLFFYFFVKIPLVFIELTHYQPTKFFLEHETKTSNRNHFEIIVSEVTIMKQRTKLSIAGLCLIFVMVGIAPSLSLRIPGDSHLEIFFPTSQEDYDVFPAEDTLEPVLDTYLNSEADSESNVIVEYDVKTGVERRYSVDYDEISSDKTHIEPFEGNHYREILDQFRVIGFDEILVDLR